MKILWIMTASFDQGGTQNDMIQLARALGPLGYELHLAGPDGGLVPELQRQGVRFHAVPDPLGSPLAMVRYIGAIAGIVRKHGFDILAPQSIRASLAAGVLRRVRWTSAPVVTSLHNLHAPNKASTAANILYPSCDALTLENRYEQRLVGLEETRGGTATRVVYSGVDLDHFRPLDGEMAPHADLPGCSGRLVGCVARLSEEKDHLTLLMAWHTHTRKHPGDRLLLVGDGPERPRIEQTIAMLGLGETVHMLGERSDVPALLPHLDLFVLSSSRESYPRSAREALCCGVPVILPAIGGCGEIVSHPDAGRLFRSGDPADLAQCLESMLEAGTDRASWRKRARDHAEKNFPLAKWRLAMDALYREFARGRRSGRAA